MDYQRIYNQLIERARSENRVKGGGSYYEAHHIVPKCMGGGGKGSEWKTHPNIILLTAREHFLAHQLLCNLYPTELKLSHALWFFLNAKRRNGNTITRVTSRQYKEAREQHALAASKQRKGKPRSQQTRDLLSKVNTGKKLSDEVRQKISRSNKSSVVKQRATFLMKKPISQYTVDGVWMRDWDSVQDVKRTLGITSVLDNLKGRQKTAGGYVWKYLNKS